jgi:hypothetical protein
MLPNRTCVSIKNRWKLISRTGRRRRNPKKPAENTLAKEPVEDTRPLIDRMFAEWCKNEWSGDEVGLY